MRWTLYAVGGLAGLVGLLVGLIYAASELGGEVVTLHRPGADNTFSPVRIWVVDTESGSWIEHGSGDADWITRLADNPHIRLERAGIISEYLATPEPDAHDQYHALRREKYGVADQLIGFLGGDNCTGTPVRLQPK